ncbi:MAG: hypothetical protein K8H88_05835, partial [Sandaracinaceae bacterium]|nr:hypothetical protein [Sandaracinaceae bacterium]
MRALALLVVLCACDRPHAPVRVEVEPPSPPPGAAAPSEPLPREPYAIRFVRPCSEWGTRDLLGTERHVFGCDGAVWDRTSGALIAIADPEDGMPRASIGARSLWISLMGRLRIAGGDGRVGEAIDVPYDYDVVASRDGAFAWVGRWSLVDLRGRTVRALRDRCAGAIALGFAGDGAPQCLVRCGDRSCLRSIDAGSETDLPAIASASFSPRGTLLAFSEGAA